MPTSHNVLGFNYELQSCLSHKLKKNFSPRANFYQLGNHLEGNSSLLELVKLPVTNFSPKRTKFRNFGKKLKMQEKHTITV